MAQYYPEIYRLRPWYHDFDSLGLQTRFADRPVDRLRQFLAPMRRFFDKTFVEKGERLSIRQLLRPVPPSHAINQQQKESIIIPFIQRCLDELGNAPTCLDLFCADGYYACTMAHRRPDAVITGVDLDEKEIVRAQTAARLLGVRCAEFAVADVWNFVSAAQPYDLILCTGGLYHLIEPRRFLERLRSIGGRFLVVQSVVTLEADDPDYFVSPAPGWKHGSRFTHTGLGHWLQWAGWRIIDAANNELSGNSRRCDRGSSYYRCEAA